MRGMLDDFRFATRALGARPGFVAAAVALTLTRFLSSLVFGISVFDPLTYVLVTLLLIAVGMSACGLPAWRATRVSPVTALRYE